jgi:hypothetical protein
MAMLTQSLLNANRIPPTRQAAGISVQPSPVNLQPPNHLTATAVSRAPAPPATVNGTNILPSMALEKT